MDSKIISFCVFVEQKRVDMFISALFTDFSRSYVQKLIDSWAVVSNNSVVKKNIKIKKYDQITISLRNKKSSIEAENIMLDIVYEDENLLVINKDAKVNTHPTPGEAWKSWTLVNAVLYHCWDNLPVINWIERPWIVHRLDKDTSGLICIAKNDAMMQHMSGIFQKRSIEKYYIAIVSWKIKDQNIHIESDIGRDPQSRIRMTTRSPINPKYASTRAECIGCIDDTYSVLKVKLETGRTHQIRVHLASIGYPIVWDSIYGCEKVNQKVATKYGVTRQMLHARELQFSLYQKQKIFVAPFKNDMIAMLEHITYRTWVKELQI